MDEASFEQLLDEVRHSLHLDVPCPVCGAGFSQPCRSSSGAYRPKVHAPREHPAAWTQEGLFADA